MRIITVGAGLVAAVALALPATAAAEERTCRGTIGAVTLDNLRVPQGASCTLEGTRLKGSAVVERDARLVARDARVNGNVQAENARNVVLVRAIVGGSVQVKQGGSARIASSQINADIQYDAQKGLVRALNNVVGGSIQAMSNTGGVEIRKNRVDGNLQCKQNQPAPFGGGNIVQGSKEDQCALL